MTSTSPNMTQLRETAVRLQADLLVVYSITSNIYHKYRAFQKNQAKAFATCETILMDTRTGVIPHSSIVTKEKLAVRDREEFAEAETRKKAEKKAVLLTLIDTEPKLATFVYEIKRTDEGFELHNRRKNHVSNDWDKEGEVLAGLHFRFENLQESSK